MASSQWMRVQGVGMALAMVLAGGVVRAQAPVQPVVPAGPGVEPVVPPSLSPPMAPVTPPVETPAAPGVAAPESATAPTPASAASEAGTGAIPLPQVKFTAVWAQYVGEGTFAVNNHVRNPLYSWWISLRPKVVLPYGFNLSIRQDLDMEWTHSENTTHDRQPMLADTRMGVSYTGLNFTTPGLKFAVYGGARAPVSLESRFRRQLGTVDVSAAVDWSKWGFIASAAALGSVNARQPGKPTVANGLLSGWWGNSADSAAYKDRTGQYIPTAKCIARASEVASGGCPVAGAANGNLAAAILFFTGGYELNALLHIPLTFSATLVTIHGFSSYFGPDDEFTPTNGKVGISRTDSTWGMLSVSWQALDWLGIDVGTSSLQPLMNKSNQYVRFPFWNIPYWDLKHLGSYSGAANYSLFSLGMTAAF